MLKLIPIITVSLVLALLGHVYSDRSMTSDGNFLYMRKNKLFFLMIAICMILFVGLRTNFNDTSAYIHAYELMGLDGTKLENFDWTIGMNPGFNMLNLLIKRVGFSSQSFLMLYASITLAIYIWFVWKYADDLLLCMFLFITMGCFTFTLAAIKQCVAVAFCLLATDAALRKKYALFIFWVLIGAMFHPYALMYLVVPFVAFRPWSKIGYAMIAVFLIVGVTMGRLIGAIVDITSMLGEEFDTQSFIGEGVNVFRVAVVWVPVILSWLAREHYEGDQKQQRVRNVIMNLATINACVMFIGLFGTANYFARLANYFLIFQVLALPMILKYYERTNQAILKIASIVCYSAYFYYAEAIANGSFDSMFRSITLGQYFGH